MAGVITVFVVVIVKITSGSTEEEEITSRECFIVTW